jgi:hypothetical protein
MPRLFIPLLLVLLWPMHAAAGRSVNAGSMQAPRCGPVAAAGNATEEPGLGAVTAAGMRVDVEHGRAAGQAGVRRRLPVPQLAAVAQRIHAQPRGDDLQAQLSLERCSYDATAPPSP